MVRDSDWHYSGFGVVSQSFISGDVTSLSPTFERNQCHSVCRQVQAEPKIADAWHLLQWPVHGGFVPEDLVPVFLFHSPLRRFRFVLLYFLRSSNRFFFKRVCPDDKFPFGAW